MEPLDTTLTAMLDPLYRYAYRETGDDWTAEELVQETAVIACRNWDKLQNKDAVHAWIWGILKNLIRRSHQPQRELPTETEELVRICDGVGVSYETPETIALRKWEISRVREAVAYLAKLYREVTVAYYLEEKDYDTISQELSIPVSSVKWRLHRSRIQLKEEICQMEFMEKSYRKAQPLCINMGGTVAHWDPATGAYDNADKALEGLLAQNICQVAYEKPLTVTEIASSLGVAADYVEDALEKLCATGCITQKSNTYQTAFPIWSAAENELVYGETYRLASDGVGALVDMLYGLEPEIRRVGFYGCDRPFERLTLMLMSWLTYNTRGNLFDGERLPFHGVEKAWYILATTAPSFFQGKDTPSIGLNSNGSSFGFVEFFLSQPHFPDNRSIRTEEQRTMEALYKGDTAWVEAHRTELAHLLETGKAEAWDGGYRLTVPVLSTTKGDWRGLREALTPALEMAEDIQAKLNARAATVMKQVIPTHLSNQRAFYETYCTHGALDVVMYQELMRRGVTVTREMTTWLSVE